MNYFKLVAGLRLSSSEVLVDLVDFMMLYSFVLWSCQLNLWMPPNFEKKSWIWKKKCELKKIICTNMYKQAEGWIMVSAITALTLTYSFGGQTLSTGDFGKMHIALKSSKLFKKSISIWNFKKSEYNGSDFFWRNLHVIVISHHLNRQT